MRSQMVAKCAKEGHSDIKEAEVIGMKHLWIICLAWAVGLLMAALCFLTELGLTRL